MENKKNISDKKRITRDIFKSSYASINPVLLSMLTIMLILIPISLPQASADMISVSQLGYHPESIKKMMVYTHVSGSQEGNFSLIDVSGDIAYSGKLHKATDYHGNPVECQGGLPCLVGDFSDFNEEGEYYAIANLNNQDLQSSEMTSYTFNLSRDIYIANMPTLLEFFKATAQQDSEYHSGMHSGVEPMFPYMADGSFLLTADQAATTLVRLGSAYNINPEMMHGLPEHILKLSKYLMSLQGLEIEEHNDGTGFRLDSGMIFNNVFIPGPTELESLDVYTPGNNPTLIQTVPVVSLCGTDDSTAQWQECIAEAEEFYKCQIDEPCLNMTYNGPTGTIVSQGNGYGVARGWTYDFGCFIDIDMETPMFEDSFNPCMVFVADESEIHTAMGLLALLKGYPAIHDLENNINSNQAAAILERSISTYNFIEENYNLQGDPDAMAYVGASLFLLYDYTGDTSYLGSAHAMKPDISVILVPQATYGNEFYWEEYIKHKDDIIANGLDYEIDNAQATDIFRGKIYGDYKDRGPRSMSRNAERVFEYDHNIQFQNSRYILTEGLFAAKALHMVPSAEYLIQEVADSQLAWITGMNAVQDGVMLGSPLRSYSFIFGIGQNFPKEFHSRYLVDTGIRSSSDERLIGARGTDLQFYNGEEFIYLDGVTEIMGYKFGTLGNGYNGEQNIRPFKTEIVFLNGMEYIPGWINGPYDINAPKETDIIFNYHDNINTYEFTETTNEMVATAIEYFAYMDALYNGNRTHTLPPQLEPPTPPQPPEGNDTYINDTNDTGENETVVPGNGNQSNQDNLTQFVNVGGIPAICIGGIITHNIFDGGRHITCENNTQETFLTISAWDKPGSHNAEFFEMYRTDFTGSGLTICLIDTCISNNGFARSPDYPILWDGNNSQDNNDTDTPQPPPNIPDETEDPDSSNDGNQSNQDNSTQFSNVEKIPAICIGGIMTHNIFDGGRHITCESSTQENTAADSGDTSNTATENDTSQTASQSASLTISAWDKPGHHNAEFFEMYRTDFVGTGLTICLLDTCISDNGFARSPDYPLQNQ